MVPALANAPFPGREHPLGAGMLEISFACPLCSRIFLADRPLQDPMPEHLDALLGTPCPTSGLRVQAFIDHHLGEAGPDDLPGTALFPDSPPWRHGPAWRLP